MIQATRFHGDAAQWNATVLRLPAPHPLQSAPWAEHKRAYGWQPQYWLYTEGDRVRGAALILRRRISRIPWGILYVPKGPLLDDWADPILVDAVLAHLEETARRQRAIFIKMDPDVDYPPAPDLCVTEGERVAAQLKGRGWLFSSAQIQYRNTVLLDLRQSEAQLLAAMKPKTRYNIRLAGRKGVTVRSGGKEDLPLFYHLYTQTSARDGFVIREYEYYRSAWERFLDAGMGCLLLAEVEGDTIAGVFLFHFGRRAWYIYGASSNEKREWMPNHLLQWEAIRWAKARGCTAYDLWGAPDELDAHDPMAGVYRFKAGFGGVLVRHIGAYDYPASRPLYWLYTVAMPRYLELLRRRHWKRTPFAARRSTRGEEALGVFTM